MSNANVIAIVSGFETGVLYFIPANNLRMGCHPK